MVEVGDAVEHDGRNHGGVLHIFGNQLVEDVPFGVPDFAVFEVVALRVRFTEGDGRNAVHREVGMVAAAGPGGTRLRLAFPLADGEGEVGIDGFQRLADGHIVVVHGFGDGNARGAERSAVTVDVVGDLVERNGKQY